MGGLYFVFEAITQGALDSMVHPYIGMVVMNTDSCFLSISIERLFLWSRISSAPNADTPSILAIQGDTAQAHRGQKVGSVFESGSTHRCTPARVGCICAYIGSARGEHIFS